LTERVDARSALSVNETRDHVFRVKVMSDLSLFDLTGKNALVTGGAIGLGRACATALARGGANVAIVDLNEDVGRRTAASIKSLGVDSFFIRCDVAKKEEVQAMTAAVAERFGSVDVGVNNAGFGIAGGGGETLAQGEWDRVLSVNLTGAFLCAQAQAQRMIRQSSPGGKIINIASMYGTVAGGNCSYNAAKAGVIHLTRTLAAEWGSFNINVNCISPSWVITPGMMATPVELRARMREVTPLGHLQRPQDIQGAVLFLASKASDFVTGHDLVVDGGHTVNTWLSPLQRAVPPRVSPEEEVAETLKDLEALGVADGSHRR
jgi:NAD(P)-dependent dehydrogenase (short-subunit alcohol dehydrogenase family)